MNALQFSLGGYAIIEHGNHQSTPLRCRSFIDGYSFPFHWVVSIKSGQEQWTYRARGLRPFRGGHDEAAALGGRR